MISTIRWLVLLLALVPGVAQAGGETTPSQAGKVPVYVFTAAPATRLITADEKSRAEALQQLTRYLKKKHRLVLVDSPQKAMVVIELMSHVQTFKPHETTHVDEHALTAMVRVGKEETRIAESRRDLPATADKLAVRIDHWIRDNVRPPNH